MPKKSDGHVVIDGRKEPVTGLMRSFTPEGINEILNSPEFIERSKRRPAVDGDQVVVAPEAGSPPKKKGA